jgi:DNA-directed RNA polymerase subunit RPC12/RpoP
MSRHGPAERTTDRAADIPDAVGEERAMLTTPSAPTAVPSESGELLSSPEPWRSTLWRALKAAVVGGAGFYSMMRLVDGTVTITGAALMGAWFGAMSLSVSRKGSLFPAAPALILGGVTLGGAAIVGATAVMSGQRMSEVAGGVAIGLFLGGVLLWMGVRARRGERALAASGADSRAAPVLVPRGELASRVEAVRQVTEADTRRFMRRLGVGMAVVVGFLLFPYERVFGAELPEVLGAGAFFGMWGAFGLLARSASRRGREVAERFGLICSACDRTYFGAFANLRLQKHLAEIGRCPNCGVRIVTED